MTDEDAFIRSICLAPEDDAPRGVFADWLDDHAGDAVCPGCVGWSRVKHEPHPKCTVCSGTGRISNGNADRAEFIRIQLEAERLDRIVTSGIYTPGPPSNAPDTSKEFARLCELRKRERELLLRWKDSWFRPPVDGLVSVVWNHPTVEWMRPEDVTGTACGSPEDVWSVTFRRGFPDLLECSTKNFIKNAKRLFSHHPITQVRLSDKRPGGGREYPNGRQDAFMWNLNDSRYVTPGDDVRSHLGDGFMQMLKGGLKALHGTVHYFDTREDAVKSLSDACVHLGRSRAGIISENPRPSAEPGNGGG